nr:MAG TPA: hypothetical protein [Caudoviricetes sp.]
MSLRPGQYVASCDVTHSEVEDVKVTFWANHTQVGTGNGAIGANVMRIDLQSDSTPCLFAVRKCRATDFIVERADTHALASGGGSRPSSPRRPRPISPQFGGGRVRIKNLYNPPTLKDYPANMPWTPGGTTSTGEKTTDGWKATVTGSGTGWLYPPQQPDGCKCVCWQKQDGTYWKNVNDGVTIPLTQAESPITITRVCGYADGELPGMLDEIGLPLVFAATDHPY